MKISLNWLNRYLKINATVEELQEVFPKIGLEVDSTEHVGVPPMSHVVVGEVLKKEKHPDADKLSVCEVAVGEESPYTIVCGAQNFKEGDRVPVALPGACLPGGFKIKKSKLRGVASHGMMCSARELGLGDSHEGLYILTDKPNIGASINDVFSGGDTIFDLEITANRGDCLSHIGIARELGAYYNLKLELPEVKSTAAKTDKPGTGDLLDSLQVDTVNCPYYTAWGVKGVKVGESPEWLKKDLEAVGLRPVNNVVDITNFVLMETGQPLHAFDANKISGKQIVVREAKDKETIKTLDGQDKTLSSDMMVIADKDRPLVIAGVMGSVDAEVDESTVDIILESAYFNPASIRSTARRVELSTDSSYSFERDVDPGMVEYAAKRALDLILQVAGGEVFGNNIVIGNPPRGAVQIEITPAYIRDICGFDIEDSAILDIYDRLGFIIEKHSEEWIVTVPSFRSEVLRPIDLVEEFLRGYGTDKIPDSKVIVSNVSTQDDPTAIFNSKSSSFLINKGFDECYHYTLRSEDEMKKWYREEDADALRVYNPLAQDQSHLRFSMMPSLMDALRLNLNNGNDVRMLFEVGKTYRVLEGQIYELSTIGFIALEKPSVRLWKDVPHFDFYDVKSILCELCNIAGLSVEDHQWASLGKDTNLWQEGHSAGVNRLSRKGFAIEGGMVNVKMSKEWQIDSFVYGGEIALMPKALKTKQNLTKFEAFSVFPPSHKDIALLVDAHMPVGEIKQEIIGILNTQIKEKHIYVQSVEVFDLYKGDKLPEGKKSVALSITFRSLESTLKDKVVTGIFDGLQQKLKEKDYAVRSQ